MSNRSMFLSSKLSTLATLTLQTCLLLSPLYLMFCPPKTDSQAAQNTASEPECVERVRRVAEQLKFENISESCAILEQNHCQDNFASTNHNASPESVFRRSFSCDILWPRFGELDQEEVDFPLVRIAETATPCSVMIKARTNTVMFMIKARTNKY